MEGKTVILSVFIMSLVMAQIQVEAKSCCPNKAARVIYDTCRWKGKPRKDCAFLSRCKLIKGEKCPPHYIDATLENNGDGFSEFCILGCVSSVCNAINTLQTSDASKIVNEAVDHCVKGCSTLCTKDSMTESA